MITANLLGGLGNQLFQIAATQALAWSHEDQAGFNYNHLPLSQGSPASSYKSTIYKNLSVIPDGPRVVYKERNFYYSPIPYHPNLALDGFFQSEKYFKGHREKLLATLDFSDITDYYPEYNWPDCAIHIRRGDYLTREEYNPVLPLDYYKKAISYFPDETRFLVISDDTEWCSRHFRGHRFSFSTGHTELEDLLLISKCPNQIIANSTFSWWGSWLNTCPNKTVIAPKKWFGEKLRGHSLKDLYFSGTLVI